MVCKIHSGIQQNCPECAAWSNQIGQALADVDWPDTKDEDGEDGKIAYAPGVEPAADGPSDREFEEALKAPGKWRVTGMIDEDLYRELRRLHGLTPGGTKFDETLNSIIRAGLSAKGVNNGG